MNELKLVKLEVVFLSPLFLPLSPITDYWTITADHVPPSSFSGFILRTLLFMNNSNHLKGDFLPTTPTEGRYIRIERNDHRIINISWITEKKTHHKDFLAPYLELHFGAVSLGVYPLSILKGNEPKRGYVQKYWNVIKYIDSDELERGLKCGLKTWHYGVFGGTRVDKKKVQVYDIASVRHVIPLEKTYGFILIKDPLLLSLVDKLRKGFFIMKGRLKTLYGIRVIEIMEPTNRKDADYMLPTPRRVEKATYTFRSAILDPEDVKKKASLPSIRLTYLRVKASLSKKDVEYFVFFKDSNNETYAIHKSWLDYLR